ncbi:hypothetical protein Gpo141_00003921 [Globisporangium polare]
MPSSGSQFFLAAFAVFACASLLAPDLSDLPHVHLPSPISSYNYASYDYVSVVVTEHVDEREHAYFRPPPDQTSGFLNNTHTYHRSPCPFLNTLANHGYFPRDGKNVTSALLKKALVEVFNFESKLADSLALKLPPVFSLADMSKHHFIEHDASLLREDSHFQQDQSLVNSSLAEELFALVNEDGDDQRIITKRVIATYRVGREAQCKARDPAFTFAFKRQLAAYAEIAAALLAMGDYESESISVEAARSFLVDERFPHDFKKSKTAITNFDVLFLAARIKATATLTWLESLVA